VRVREAAAQALDRIDTPAAVHALVGALRDSSPAVRRIAAGALPRAAGHLVPVAVAFMTDRLRIESDAEVAHALVDALQTMATPEAFGALAVLAVRPGAGPQSAQVAAAAWRALRAAQPRRLMVALRGAAAGGDPQLAGAAVQVARAVAAPRNTAPASMAAVPGPASAGPAAAAR
jgi:HEAT repeat protein